MSFDEIFSAIMTLSSQHRLFKPCIGHMRLLLTQVSVLFFLLLTFFCLHMFTRQVHVLLFLTYRRVRDGTWRTGCPALT